jgi:DNA (cytosine-5)-methyltransferase 1
MIDADRKLVGIDLFAGAGGFSIAAAKAGVSIVAALESDRHACSTYRRNFITGKQNPPILIDKDAQLLTPEKLLATVALHPGECDLVIGGPPCQGFSSHRLKQAGVDDPRNDLLIRYFQFVEALRPAAFLVENVPGMLWSRHFNYVEAFYSLASKAGYVARPPLVLNARDYGVPQNRRRVFILATRRDLRLEPVWPPPPTHGNPKCREVISNKLEPWLTARTVFEQPAPQEDPNDRHMNHCRELVDAFRRTPLDGGSRREAGRVLECHKEHDGHSDAYGRIALSAPGPTMTTACINPSKGRFVHPTENHGITIRQAARFQTFPDDFIFEGGLMAAGVQIGNAIPLELGVAVLTAIVAAFRANGRSAE